MFSKSEKIRKIEGATLQSEHVALPNASLWLLGQLWLSPTRRTRLALELQAGDAKLSVVCKAVPEAEIVRQLLQCVYKLYTSYWLPAKDNAQGCAYFWENVPLLSSLNEAPLAEMLLRSELLVQSQQWLWKAPVSSSVMLPALEVTISGHADIVMSVAFSPDGNKIVSGSADKMIRL